MFGLCFCLDEKIFFGHFLVRKFIRSKIFVMESTRNFIKKEYQEYNQ